VMTHEHHQQRPNTSPATNSIKVIPWVRVTDANGKITVYKSRENPLKRQQVTAAHPRVIDSINCP
jgi:hypothetical protein